VSGLITLVVFVVVVGGLLVLSSRARRRQTQIQLDRAERIAVGTEVMTTSGLYGTVVGRNDDDSVLLAIAPGVEVRWALAALRDLNSLPREYRGRADGAETDAGDAP
jgi:preprotein translocase subunit YajC